MIDHEPRIIGKYHGSGELRVIESFLEDILFERLAILDRRWDLRHGKESLYLEVQIPEVCLDLEDLPLVLGGYQQFHLSKIFWSACRGSPRAFSSDARASDGSRDR